MKKYFTVILCLMLWSPVIHAVEITDKVLTEYYKKGKIAFDKEQWIDAIKYFFVYRELSVIGKATQAELSEIDSYIKTAEEKLSPLTVRPTGGGGGLNRKYRPGTVLIRPPDTYGE
ncbi:hypothetical protein [Nitrosospira sp. Nsp1]|uniref:hypothetical protein n=1 Tax=Nitrosospira sp. Nsp1 TaxID=136547 RepID=UPI00088BAC73|nr:hypothetical protein [Nitrosospira sp. Nsp1]SCX62749.1 hypothetical protein SAMN05720354_13230 [Nitrosospira sp. Nsp1]